MLLKREKRNANETKNMYLVWRGAVIELRDGFHAGDFLLISNEHKRFYIRFPHTK